jgi:peptidase A4-like protein
MPEQMIGKCKVRTFELPPKGFDPFEANAAKLLHHGFPRRPDPATEPEASLHWVRAMRKYRDLQFKHVVPEFKSMPTHIHGPNKRVTDKNRGLVNATSSNWSGSVVFIDPNIDPFVWMFGQWTVPNAYSPNPGDGNTYYSSAWIGIDGDGSPDVLQAGTATEVTGGNPAVCYAWWEWFPDFSVAIPNFPFAQGDAATLLICSTGPNTAWFSFGNLTSLQYTSFSITAPQGTTLVGNCAEAVLERPGVNGGLAELPRYGENVFDATTAYTKSGSAYDIGTGTTISMVADDGVTVISTPEVMDADAVRMSYTGP